MDKDTVSEMSERQPGLERYTLLRLCDTFEPSRFTLSEYQTVLYRLQAGRR